MTTQNWRHIGIVEIRDRNGARRQYSNLTEALTDFGWARINAFLIRHEGDHRLDDGSVRPPPWRIVDELGLDIPDALIRREFDSLQLQQMVKWAWAISLCPEIPAGEFRRSPVPRTGKRHRNCWYRSIRTTQERRARAALETDDEAIDSGYVIRQRRVDLPSSWDDQHRHVSRSWKDHRLTRWK